MEKKTQTKYFFEGGEKIKIQRKFPIENLQKSSNI